MVYCRHCGDQIPVDSVFCPSCGHNLLLDTASANPSPEGAAVVQPAREQSPRGRTNWTEKLNLSGIRRYIGSIFGIIRFEWLKRRTSRWSVSQVLMGASFAFSLVGFLWSLLGHHDGFSWIGFAIVLGLGAIYTKGSTNRTDPPDVSE